MSSSWKGMVLVAAALVAVLATGCSGGANANTTVIANVEHSITVTSSAQVKVVPDKARIDIGVTSQEATAEQAQTANAQAVDALISALVSQGVAEKDIQTEYVNLYPSYDYSSNAPSIVGYEMTTSLAVSGLDVNAVGDVLEAAVAAGATRTDGIRFYASNYDEAYAQALNDAIAASKEKAQTMAKTAGVRLGGIIGVTEGYQDASARYGSPNALYAADTAASGSSLKTMPGELDVEANVTVSYVIE